MESRPYAANRIVGRDAELQRLAGVLGAGDGARVAVHVSNILAKLGMRSRTEIAAWAIRTGVAEHGVERAG